MKTGTSSLKPGSLESRNDVHANRGNLYILPSESALREAIPVLSCLVRDRDFLDSHVLPHLEEAGRAKDWYVAFRHDGPDCSYSLQVFVWPPGSATRIHDHSSWGAFCCVVGIVLEERYARADDSSVPGYARLRRLWQLEWSREDAVSTVLPYSGGIHRVSNPTEEPSISVHLYGPRLGEIDGRDYEPSQDYVCDRSEDEVRGARVNFD